MGIGREVADAYIQVHGDLKKFRKSLAGAAKDGKAAGADAADGFSAGWDKRTEANFTKKWDGIMDSLHSNKKVDWERLVGTFDAKGFSDAKNRINSFLAEAAKDGIITEQQYTRSRKAIKQTMDALDAEHKLALKNDEEKKKLRERDLAFKQATKEAIKEATAEQERYNKTFAGMFRITKLKELESDFNRVTEAMAKGDWSKFTKGSKDLPLVADRIRTVVQDMQYLGRVTEEEGDRIVGSVNRHVVAEDERRKAIQRTKDETARLKEQQAAYNRSLQGMMDTSRLADLDKAFKKIAVSLQTQDWSSISRGHTNMRDFRRQVTETATELRRTGRVSEDEFNRIRTGLTNAARGTNGWTATLGQARGGMSVLGSMMTKLSTSFRRMDGTVKMVLMGIAAAAGPMAAALSGAAASATALVSSLAMAAGAAVPLAGAVVGVAVGVGLMVSAMDDMKASFPAIQQGMDNIAATWEQQSDNFAAKFGESFGNMLGALNTQLASVDFGTPMGVAFSAIGDAFTGIINGPGFTALMQAMTTDLPAATQGLGVGLAGVFGALSSMLAGAAPVARMLGEDFARWGTNLSTSMESLRESGKLTEVFEKSRESLLAVLDLTGSVGKMLGSLFMLGSTEGNSMLTSLTGIVDKFTAWSQTAEGAATITEWFSNGAEIIRSMEPLVVGLGEALGGLVTEESIAQFGDLMTTLGEFLPILGEILGVISSLGIINILAEALTAVGTAIQPLLPPLQDLFQLLGPLLSDAITVLTPILTSIAEALAPVIAAVTDIVARVGPPLLEGITKIADALAPVIEVIGVVVEVISAILVPILSGLLIGAINAVVHIVQGLSDVFMGVWGVVKGFAELVIAIFTGDWAAIPDILLGIWDSVVQIFLGALEAIWGFINLYLIGKVFSGIKTVMTSIKGIFDDIWNGISGFMKNIWDDIVGFITNALSRMGSGVTSGLNSVKGFFSSAWSSVVSGVQTAFNSVVGAVSGGISNVIGFVGGLPGKIGSALSGLVGQMLNIGSNMMSGMISGIAGMATKLLNSAMSAVKGAVDGVKNFLGIRSPSRLFMQMGSYMGEGMAIGIEDRARMVTDAAKNMVSATTAEFSSSAMYVAGLDAAHGLAKGLTDGASKVQNAYGSLAAPEVPPGTFTYRPSVDSDAAQEASRGKSIVIESGAIRLESKVTDPELAADKVLDGLVTVLP